MAIGDLWRWGQHSAADQADLARFWRQVSRWLVTDVPDAVELRVIPATARQGVELRVTAKDREFRPLEIATVRITLRRIETGHDDKAAPTSKEGFKQAVLTAEPSTEVPGRYVANFTPRDTGGYLAVAEVSDRTGRGVGRAEAGWVHDPAADEFRSLAPNLELLRELSRRTGGAMIDRTELAGLAERLAHAPAPVTEIHSQPLWHNPWMFAAVLGCFLAEWAWRRWKGLP